MLGNLDEAESKYSSTNSGVVLFVLMENIGERTPLSKSTDNKSGKARMPYWILKCPQCKKDFVHSEINIDKEHYGLWALPSKPEFPEAGSWLECTNCKKTSLFQRFQLMFARS